MPYRIDCFPSTRVAMTSKGIKQEATCGLAFDFHRVMCLHNDVTTFY